MQNGDFTKFPLVFDINLDYTSAMNRLQYLVDGNYIDNATQSVEMLLTTYNGEGSRGSLTGEGRGACRQQRR